ncbi:dsRNA-binding domain-like protein [Suhomyces tanzawaensis NRRL Y-17324]|uniref:DNA repair and recombination protein RAD52 n=1 Tax=Suhomyces tanzawaensis NRRL Y-17324 TaxID=984487 RepID=A0A1E4SHR5_9ASCO|nr:dsRNA-binding domain-like protein [Suhomyces tanzawaensis NRRL Y-17324]ODV79036.1 dsRNA-binding domain-like protein [Suhomyces tanzawaensis NRRL Y-17324]
MPFDFDSKYEVSEEVANLPSTVEFFPDLSQFEEQEKQEEEPDFIPEWSLRKIATLQSKLEAIQNHRANSKGFFGSRDLISNFGSSLIFGLANEVFGFNGWSTELVEYTKLLEEADEENSRYSAKFSAIIRVVLKDGAHSEDFGIGEAINMPHRYMCYSKCKKQAITEATKNAVIGLSYRVVDYEMKKFEQQLKQER